MGEAGVPTLVSEATAWTLLRNVSVETATASTSKNHHDSRDVRLQVDTTGNWELSDQPSEEARNLLDLYAPLQANPDLVIGQIGQSLDGRIATENGRSHYITGRADIRRLHRLRALVDAVVVGARTVAADNPRLTVREVPGQNPVRVILDPDGRLASQLSVFRDKSARTLVVTRAPKGRNASILKEDRIELPTSDPKQSGHSGFTPQEILEALRGQGLRRILIEGGGLTVSRFLQARALTRLHVTVAPLLIGSGRHALTLPTIDSLNQALRPPCRLFHLGDDLLFDLDVGVHRTNN